MHKVMPIVWNFARIRNLLDSNTALTFYTSLIRPHLEYAAAVYTPSTFIRNQINIPSLKQRRVYLFMCEFYKLYNNISENITTNFITRTHVQPRHSLRHANIIFLPSMNKSVGQRALCYLGPKTFNDLPKKIKATRSYLIFKKQLKSHLLKYTN